MHPQLKSPDLCGGRELICPCEGAHMTVWGCLWLFTSFGKIVINCKTVNHCKAQKSLLTVNIMQYNHADNLTIKFTRHQVMPKVFKDKWDKIVLVLIFSRPRLPAQAWTVIGNYVCVSVCLSVCLWMVLAQFTDKMDPMQLHSILYQNDHVSSTMHIHFCLL